MHLVVIYKANVCLSVLKRKDYACLYDHQYRLYTVEACFIPLSYQWLVNKLNINTKLQIIKKLVKYKYSMNKKISSG